MTPETRSRGVAPPSRVYHTEPVLQQVQFPSRRKKIRTYGRQTSDRLRQQTLTQIDSASSFDDDDDDGVIVLTDSEGEARDKENRDPEPPPGESLKRGEETRAIDERAEEHEDAEPVPSRRRVGSGRKRPVPCSINKGNKSKRRRTLGDAKDTKGAEDDKSSRRRTMGDMPAASKFHTQTLTQFLGHRSHIADSDDDQDDGFLDWLGGPGSPSLGRGKTASRPSPLHDARSTVPASGRDASPSVQSREESVIPQTPVKRTHTIRFAVSPEASGGLASRMGRYGPPDMLTSPLKDRSSPAAPLPLELTGTPRHLEATPTPRQPARRTPANSRRGTPSPYSLRGTPSPNSRQGTPSPISRRGTPSPKKKSPFPKTSEKGIREIPDSDDEDGVFGHESGQDDYDARDHDDDHCYGAGAETLLAFNALAYSDEELLLDKPCPDAVQLTSTQALRASSAAPEALEATAPIPSTPSPGAQPALTPLRTPKPKSQPGKPIRKPLYYPSSSPLPSQPLESQRVPISILQSLPPHTPRSDILLPVDDPSLAALLGGHRVHMHAPFKIPDQVVRFWLFDGALLRYMACVEPPGDASRDADGNHGWRYYVKQVYELNNPLEDDDMREEGWLDGPVAKYVYLPPAVVGQLLWNLRHALFRDAQDAAQPHRGDAGEVDGAQADDELPRNGRPARRQQRRLAKDETPAADGTTVSQQVAAQIRSDIAHSTQVIPSTQDDDDDGFDIAEEQLSPVIFSSQPRSSSNTKAAAAATAAAATSVITITTSPHLPPPPPPPARPSIEPVPCLSQATTASQSSTPEQHHHDSLDGAGVLALLGHGNTSGAPPSSPLPSALASQLLSGSQLLPESLVRDHSPPSPPEIWDSDDDDAPL